MDETTRPLTAKQKRFCDEYMVDMNGKQAAIRAGYSEHTAEQQGSRLYSNAKVFAEIQRLIDERAERVEVDADYVVMRLKAEAELTGEGSTHGARVSALTVLARHLGMLTDKLDITGHREILLIRRGDEPSDTNRLAAGHDPALPESLPDGADDDDSGRPLGRIA